MLEINKQWIKQNSFTKMKKKQRKELIELCCYLDESIIAMIMYLLESGYDIDEVIESAENESHDDMIVLHGYGHKGLGEAIVEMMGDDDNVGMYFDYEQLGYDNDLNGLCQIGDYWVGDIRCIFYQR